MENSPWQRLFAFNLKHMRVHHQSGTGQAVAVCLLLLTSVAAVLSVPTHVIAAPLHSMPPLHDLAAALGLHSDGQRLQPSLPIQPSGDLLLPGTLPTQPQSDGAASLMSQYCTPPLCLDWSSTESDFTGSVAWGDVDGDGDLDLVVGNEGFLGGHPIRLYRNDNGVLTHSAAWSSVEVNWATSVAWGDVDGDGDLDLAVGNGFMYPNRLYRNDNGVLTTSAVWSSIEGDGASSVAWGDVDGDGDLDLAAGSTGQSNRLYRNDNGTLTTSAVWLSAENGGDVVWGDVDGDGDLDLAVGSSPNRLYRNDNGVLTTSAVWSSAESNATSSVTWGDVDGDGDLDLAVGNNGQPNRLYRNDDGVLTSSAVWSSAENDYTQSMAWGDVDGDGDLDLAVGNYDQYNRLYRNDNGVLTASAAWSSAELNYATSVAWGDVDNDGDLDLAVGNDGGLTRLYRNGSGVLTAGAAWSALESDKPSSAAWGDVDGDGDLDLAVGSGPSRLYRNDDGALTANAVWSSTDMTGTTSIAWGDVDGDGDLDLAVGKSGEYDPGCGCFIGMPNLLYRNDNGVLTTSAVWTSAESDATNSVAWGDVDNDGDLDLAVGNTWQANRLYRNDNGVLTASAVWSSGESIFKNTQSVAWGDMDGDGDLDLAAGIVGGFNQVYRNDGGVLSTNAVWSSSEINDWGFSLAWGDVDGDGDLDLAVGNRNGPNRLYRNDNGVLTASAVWSSAESDGTTGIAWGDVDGDGDLDLAVGNEYAPNRLYRNDNGVLTASAAWSSLESDGSNSVAWGDVDGDGDLDLAVGSGPIRIYRNNRDGRTLPGAVSLVSLARPAPPQNADFYSSPQIWADSTRPIAYTLYDRGGLPVQQVMSQYSLNGGGQWFPAIAANGTVTTDLSTANYFTRTYPNNTSMPIPDLSTITSSSILTPADAIADIDVRLNLTHTYDSDLVIKLIAPFNRAVLLVNRRGGSGDNFVNTIFDDEALTSIVTGTAPFAGRFRPEQNLSRFDGYPVNGTWTLEIADIIDGDNGTLLSWEMTVTLNSGVVHTFDWDVFKTGIMGQTNNVVFRMTAMPTIVNTSNSIPGPYLHGSYASVTFPFRVRGTQVRVLSGTLPVSNALVYRLPASQTDGAQPFVDVSGNPFRTDGQGYLQGRGRIDPGDRLIALYPISATESYTLYATSATPTLSGLNMYTVTQAGVQALTVSAAKPLILFNLNVALEWDARQDAATLNRLTFDLQRASELLYDWTDGQAALGHINIYQGGEQWNDANVRILANNRLRPNASQGGIVSTTLSEIINTSITTTQVITYEPGQIRMAINWNRYGDPGSVVGDDWARAFAHELGHYLFFQDDNYLGYDAAGNFVAVSSCPGAMSDPYSVDKANGYDEFHPLANWASQCANTLANRETGRSDWQTLKRFYPALNETGTTTPGPSSLPLAVTQIEVRPIQSSQLAIPMVSPLYSLVRAEGGSYAPQRASAYLFQDTDHDGLNNRLVELGSPVSNKIEVHGARVGNRLCVIDPEAKRLGCAVLDEVNRTLALTSRPDWSPSVQITPITSRTIQVAVSGVTQTVSVQAQLFPRDGDASSVIALAKVGTTNTYLGTFVLANEALEASVHIWVDEGDTRRETVSNYSIGGNPAPRRPGTGSRRFPPRRFRRAPVLSSDGQAQILGIQGAFPLGEFYALQSVDNFPPPPIWTTSVGQAYRLAKSARAPNLAGSTFTVNYLDSEVPFGEESSLTIYYLPTCGSSGAGQPPASGVYRVFLPVVAKSGTQSSCATTWRALPTMRDAEGDLVSAQTAGEGLYLILSSIDIPLHQGWNNVAYPVAESRPVAVALASIAGKYTSVCSYQADDVDNPWHCYGSGIPPFGDNWINDLTTLEFGTYWIYATQDVILSLKGPYGGALVNQPDQSELPPAIFYGTIEPAAAFTAQAGMLITAMADGVVCGRGKVIEEDGLLRYVIDVRAVSLSGEACGRPGGLITFAIENQPLSPVATWDNSQIWQLDLSPAP